MATNVQLLRSSSAYKRPSPAPLLDGQVCMNFNAAEPGLFFRLTNGELCKAGPVAITDSGDPPNANPAGNRGNSVGEQWLNSSPLLDSPILYVFNGNEFVSANGFKVNKTTGDLTCDRNLKLKSLQVSGAGINGDGDWSIQPDQGQLVAVDNTTGQRYSINLTALP